MILVIDNTHRKLRGEIRTSLLKLRIPCVVSDLDHADLYMPAALTVVTEKYLYNDALYISKLNGNSNIIFWDEETDIYTLMYRTYTKLYGNTFEKSKIGRIRTNGKEVIFCGKQLYLTSSEHRILNLLQYAPRWYERDIIAAYCLKDGKSAADAAAVHICNMNAKATRSAGCDIIECRRFSGYRLNIF